MSGQHDWRQTAHDERGAANEERRLRLIAEQRHAESEALIQTLRQILAGQTNRVEKAEAEVTQLREECHQWQEASGQANVLFEQESDRAEKAEAECERLEVQLGGCGGAALGYNTKGKQGDYGWSPSYKDVVTLRQKVRELELKISQDAAIGITANKLYNEQKEEMEYLLAHCCTLFLEGGEAVAISTRDDVRRLMEAEERPMKPQSTETL